MTHLISIIAILLISFASLIASSPITIRFKRDDEGNTPGFDYDNDKVRGINIGGWLVLEP